MSTLDLIASLFGNQKIALTDTETVNPNSEHGFNANGNLVFDIGLVATDGEGNVFASYNKLVKEIWEDKTLMQFYVFDDSKLEWYQEQIDAGKLEVAPIKQISSEVRAFVKEHELNVIAAYNLGFDIRAINDTAAKFQVPSFFEFDKMEQWDIYHMACHALENNDNFVVAMVEHGLVSASGNVKTNAEAVYSFIHNDFTFIEDHTALSDCYIEADIIKWVLAKEKREGLSFKRTVNPSAWRLPQKKKSKK